jgi:hypothetical protein
MRFEKFITKTKNRFQKNELWNQREGGWYDDDDDDDIVHKKDRTDRMNNVIKNYNTFIQ